MVKKQSDLNKNKDGGKNSLPSYFIRAVNDFTSAQHRLSASYIAIAGPEVLGTAYLYGNVKETHLGIKIKSAWRGQGIEADLLASILAYVVQHEIQQVRAVIATEDEALRQLLETAGFEPTPFLINRSSRQLVLTYVSPSAGRESDPPGKDEHQP